MKRNLKQTINGTLFLLVTAFFNFIAAAPVPAPPPLSGGGTGGPGAPPSSPIDMYQILLFVVAVTLVVYFYKKIKLSKV